MFGSSILQYLHTLGDRSALFFICSNLCIGKEQGISTATEDSSEPLNVCIRWAHVHSLRYQWVATVIAPELKNNQ